MIEKIFLIFVAIILALSSVSRFLDFGIRDKNAIFFGVIAGVIFVYYAVESLKKGWRKA